MSVPKLSGPLPQSTGAQQLQVYGQAAKHSKQHCFCRRFCSYASSKKTAREKLSNSTGGGINSSLGVLFSAKLDNYCRFLTIKKAITYWLLLRIISLDLGTCTSSLCNGFETEVTPGYRQSLSACTVSSSCPCTPSFLHRTTLQSSLIGRVSGTTASLLGASGEFHCHCITFCQQFEDTPTESNFVAMLPC